MTSSAPKLKPRSASATKNIGCEKLMDMITSAMMVTTRLTSSDLYVPSLSMIWPNDRRPTRFAHVLTVTTTPPRATAAELAGSSNNWTAAMEATLPTSSVPAVAAKANVTMRTQKRGVRTISPGVRSPNVPAWAPAAGAT